MNHLIQDTTIRSITFILCPREDEENEEEDNDGSSSPATPVILTQLLDGGTDRFVALRSDSRTYTTPDQVLQLIAETRMSDVIFLSCPSSRLIRVDDKGEQVMLPPMCKCNNSTNGMSLKEAADHFDDAAFFISRKQTAPEGDDTSSPSSSSCSFLTGRKIAQTLSQIGEGVVFIDSQSTEAVCLAAAHQYASCVTMKSQQLRNLLCTIVATTAAAAPPFDASFRHASDSNAAERLFSFPGAMKAASDALLQNCPLDRTQLPGRLVPLRSGDDDDNDDRKSQQQNLVKRVFDRLGATRPGLARFQALPAATFGLDSSVLWRSGIFAATPTNGKNFPIMWNQDGICLVSLNNVANEHHTEMLWSLFNSKSWIGAIGSNVGVDSKTDAADYIANRPLKMLREHGIGSFVILSHDGRDPKAPPSVDGITGLILRDHFAPKLDLGFGLLEAAHGRGVAARAATLVLLWAQKLLGQRTIKAVTRASNAASQKLLKRLGFENVESESFEGWGAQQNVWSLEM